MLYYNHIMPHVIRYHLVLMVGTAECVMYVTLFLAITQHLTLHLRLLAWSRRARQGQGKSKKKQEISWFRFLTAFLA